MDTISLDTDSTRKFSLFQGTRRVPSGILTTGGDLFCGDLLIDMDKPVLNEIIDNSAAANASVERLKSLNIHTVYPGHGKPFPMEQFIKNNDNSTVAARFHARAATRGTDCDESVLPVLTNVTQV